MSRGRFAPSPSGPLHLGNLRTAMLSWLFARSSGSEHLLRVEDLDAVSSRAELVAGHQRDLRALGIDWDGPVVRQSERFDRYREALAHLEALGLLYPCYCSRREVQAAVRASHGRHPEGTYPGTCRELTSAERAALERGGRPPAWRLRAGGARVEIVDRWAGPVSAVVDDFVVRRNDGAPAYNLAVVVDDHLQAVEEVVRGDDLLETTPRQAHVADLLGWERPAYTHVPLVLGPDGRRLAKRHGAVTLTDCAEAGIDPPEVRRRLLVSIGAPDAPFAEVADSFQPSLVPREPWVVDWF